MEEEVKIGCCEGCDNVEVELTNDYKHYWLCKECNDSYNNKTGWCSLSCCISGRCDQTC